MFVARNRVHVAFGTFVNQNVEYRGAFVPRETRYAVWKKQAYRIQPFCKQNERALVGTSTKNWNLWFSNVKYVSMYLIIVKKCEILCNLYTIKHNHYRNNNIFTNNNYMTFCNIHFFKMTRFATIHCDIQF